MEHELITEEVLKSEKEKSYNEGYTEGYATALNKVLNFLEGVD